MKLSGVRCVVRCLEYGERGGGRGQSIYCAPHGALVQLSEVEMWETQVNGDKHARGQIWYAWIASE